MSATKTSGGITAATKFLAVKDQNMHTAALAVDPDAPCCYFSISREPSIISTPP
jgi:hypothetical protein